MTMSEEILLLVTKRKSVSFAELSDNIAGFNGDLAIIQSGDGYDNLCWWVGMSKEAIAALEELRRAKAIHPVTTSALVYWADGCVPQMPIAKSKRKYKKPHWVPIVFNPGPDPQL